MVGSSDGTDGKTYSIKKIVLHPDYDQYSYSYNYALIKVKGKFKWGDNVANVSLPSAEPKAKTSFVVAGYGDTVSLGCLQEYQRHQDLILSATMQIYEC